MTETLSQATAVTPRDGVNRGARRVSHTDRQAHTPATRLLGQRGKAPDRVRDKR